MATETDKHICPNCGGNNFGRHDGTAVTIGGWHGGLRFAWGRYANTQMVRCTGKRCEDCGHQVSVNPNWDRGSH